MNGGSTARILIGDAKDPHSNFFFPFILHQLDNLLTDHTVDSSRTTCSSTLVKTWK